MAKLWIPKVECVKEWCECPCHQEYKIRPDILGCMWGGEFRRHRFETEQRRAHWEAQMLNKEETDEETGD